MMGKNGRLLEKSAPRYVAHGLDPKARMPGGGTLLHNLVTMSHSPRHVAVTRVIRSLTSSGYA